MALAYSTRANFLAAPVIHFPMSLANAAGERMEV